MRLKSFVVPVGVGRFPLVLSIIDEPQCRVNVNKGTSRGSNLAQDTQYTVTGRQNAHFEEPGSESCYCHNYSPPAARLPRPRVGCQGEKVPGHCFPGARIRKRWPQRLGPSARMILLQVTRGTRLTKFTSGFSSANESSAGSSSSSEESELTEFSDLFFFQFGPAIRRSWPWSRQV